MMEFTISRVALCICGIVLISVGVAVADFNNEQKESSELEDVGKSVSFLLDNFWFSELESIHIPDDLIKVPGCVVTVSSGVVTVSCNGLEYSTVTSYPGSIEFGYNHGIDVNRRTSPRSYVWCR